MKRISTSRRVAAATTLALAAFASAAYGDSFLQWAPVVRTTPVYSHTTQPQQQCWVESVTMDEYVDRNGVPLGAVAGGITGGVVGNELGTRNRDLGTAVGAISGAAIGAAIDRERAGITIAPVTRDVERCRMVDVGRDVLQGYDVTYRFQDRDFTTRLTYDPGTRVQVRVDVAPGSR